MTKSPDRPLWRRAALPASLLVNLFLAAVIVGHVSGHLGWAKPTVAGSMLDRVLAMVDATLPPPDAAAFDAVVHREAPNHAAAAREMHRARTELERRIVAEPFDKTSVRQALLGWQDSRNRFYDDIADTVVDALAEISPQGRGKLVEAHRRALKELYSEP